MDVVEELWPLPRWTQSRGEELANAISHGIGLLTALIATPVLLLAALDAGSNGFFVGTIIFAVTMLVLYLGSTLYHAWPQTRAKCVLQVFDHSAIFLLIAGTYTPFTLGPLRGGMGWLPLIVIGPLALAIPPSALFWLVAGGIAYTTGVLFFVSNRLRYAHLVWHLFVLGGTSCHFPALLCCNWW